MIDKLGINIVGAVDHSTRLYNKGDGFAGMAGSIDFGKGDSIYLGFTAERAYTVAVEGDLVVSTETSDSRTKLDGVYGFDVDWSERAKRRGFGVGKLVITNPSAPGAVSMFVVRMEATRSVVANFGKDTGINVRVVLGADSDLAQVDRSVANAMAGGKPLADSSAVRRARQRDSARPSGFIPQDLSDHWAGSDVGHLRRNILT
ncbi:MAG: hypothetical protein IT342_21745 [Candidatus Melainabacteria bacterium]|nr:hypothetical protein [Candidatus Melainabacteria bacterium]